jgi:xylulokinase
MHGATTIDADGKVIRPCILWNDTRSYKEAASLDADPMFRRLTGNIVFPGFTAPKLKWMAAQRAGSLRARRKVLLPKDYLRLWLTGEAISEMSDSAGTSWLDTGKRAWDDRSAGRHRSCPGHMPSLVEGTERGGSLRPTWRRSWPAGGHRRSPAGRGQCGFGLRHGNDGRRSRLSPRSARRACCLPPTTAICPIPTAPCMPSVTRCRATWHQMGVILSATDSLNWLAGITSTALGADRRTGRHAAGARA